MKRNDKEKIIEKFSIIEPLYGRGYIYECGSITISGGTVNATGYLGAGIGGGYLSSCGSITIDGGIVNAAAGSNSAAKAA